jgi:hypothetical protein
MSCGRRGNEIAFTQSPTATTVGDTTRIRFEASAATSVEVAIVDAEGAVLRHLAAVRRGDGD